MNEWELTLHYLHCCTAQDEHIFFLRLGLERFRVTGKQQRIRRRIRTTPALYFLGVGGWFITFNFWRAAKHLGPAGLSSPFLRWSCLWSHSRGSAERRIFFRRSPEHNYRNARWEVRQSMELVNRKQFRVEPFRGVASNYAGTFVQKEDIPIERLNNKA